MSGSVPLICTTISQIRQAVAEARKSGKSIGLVPTMGALHAGHISLIRQARQRAGFVVVSIFVNPTQFGPTEDFARYPRPFEQDVALCAAEGVDLIFHPAVAEMYPEDYQTFVEVHELQKGLCGASRPGHFRGVATVVLKLFNIVLPDLAWFGQKDAQQVRILQQMVRDLNVPVEIRVEPTVREPDGLASSSRNQYLTGEERHQAPAIYQALQEAEQQIAAGERDPDTVRRTVLERLEAIPGLRVDYVAVVDHQSLRPPKRLSGRVLVAVAVFLGTTRLIDNVLVEVDSNPSSSS